jgi:hypothetical protein
VATESVLPPRPPSPVQVFERQVIKDQINECPYRLAQVGCSLAALPLACHIACNTHTRQHSPAALLLSGPLGPSLRTGRFDLFFLFRAIPLARQEGLPLVLPYITRQRMEAREPALWPYAISICL